MHAVRVGFGPDVTGAKLLVAGWILSGNIGVRLALFWVLYPRPLKIQYLFKAKCVNFPEEGMAGVT